MDVELWSLRRAMQEMIHKSEKEYLDVISEVLYSCYRWRLREDSRLVSERGRKAIVGRVSSLEVTLEDVDENKDEQVLSIPLDTHSLLSFS